MESIYSDKLVQLHDQGIVERMRQLSGDPSAILPPSIDMASPVIPVVDISTPQERTVFMFHAEDAGGAPTRSLSFDADKLFAKAQSWQFMGASWDTLYATANDGVLDIWANVEGIGGALASPKINLGSAFHQFGGPARTVRFILQNNGAFQMNPAIWNRSQENGSEAGFRIDSFDVLEQVTSGGPNLNVMQNFMMAFRLTF